MKQYHLQGEVLGLLPGRYSLSSLSTGWTVASAPRIDSHKLGVIHHDDVSHGGFGQEGLSVTVDSYNVTCQTFEHLDTLLSKCCSAARPLGQVIVALLQPVIGTE